MEGAIKEQIEELNRYRADYAALFQNFKQARAIFEEKDQLSNAQLQLVLTKNEALERKVEVQKNTIHSQKSARKGFENDVNQLKYATELLEERERCIYSKEEAISTEVIQLKSEMKLQKEIISRQLADIDRLNGIIANETVPKVAFDRLSFEIESLSRVMKEEMINLDIHQQVKEKYADLQCRAEWGMISLDEHSAVVSNLESMQIKLEGSVSRKEHADLLDKYQRTMAERIEADENMDNITLERDNALKTVADAKAKFLALEAHLEKTETELIDANLANDSHIERLEQLRYDVLRKGEEKKLGAERNLTLEASNVALMSQLESMKLLLDKELSSIVRLEKSLHLLRESTDMEKNVLREELEGLKKTHSDELEIRNFRMESVQSKSTQCEERAASLHSHEMATLRTRMMQQIADSTVEKETALKNAEILFENLLEASRNDENIRIKDLTDANELNLLTIITKHNEAMQFMTKEHSSEVEAVVADRQLYLEEALKELQQKHGEEITDLEHRNQVLLKSQKDEIHNLESLKRKEEINCDLERIRADSAETELAEAKKKLIELSVKLDREKEREAEWQNERKIVFEMEREAEKVRNDEEEKRKERERELVKQWEESRQQVVQWTQKEAEEKEKERRRAIKTEEDKDRARELRKEQDRDEREQKRKSEKYLSDEKDSDRVRDDLREQDRADSLAAKEAEKRREYDRNEAMREKDIACKREEAIERERDLERKMSQEREREYEREIERLRENERVAAAQWRSSDTVKIRMRTGIESPGSAERSAVHLSAVMPLTYTRETERQGVREEGVSGAVDNTHLLEITRSLESCSFSQLVHMAAKGMIMESTGQDPNPRRGASGSPQRGGTFLESQDQGLSPMADTSVANVLDISGARTVDNTLMTFESPGSSVPNELSFQSKKPSHPSTPQPQFVPHPTHTSPMPFIPSFDTQNSPLIPNFTALQQLRFLASRQAGATFSGADSRRRKDSERGDSDVDISERRSRGVSAHSIRRDSSSGRRASSNWAESLDLPSPPLFSTSPLVTPFQSMSHKNSAGRRAANGGLLSNEDAYKNDRRSTPHAPTAHTGASPSDSSREELLDRLISLTKEAGVKSSLGFMFTPPL